MKIRFLLIGTSLSLIPNLTFAQCVATQDCATLGYTETSCNGGNGVMRKSAKSMDLLILVPTLEKKGAVTIVMVNIVTVLVLRGMRERMKVVSLLTALLTICITAMES